ncbi:transposase [Bradyrhizobium sp. ARR65]|uniref:transposase n=1 Tax=Bradyrhizobium sp. ARR65 TaxID=1040989 RepID=UPI0004670F19|nr:transposase [Bradyrhizobium sp. ARR65]
MSARSVAGVFRIISAEKYLAEGHRLANATDRRVISWIIDVLRAGCRWQDCPSCYGPPTTIYNRFHRWSARGIWQKLFRALVTASPNDVHMIDSTTAKAHRSASGGKGGRRNRRSGARAAGARPKSTPLSTACAGRSPSR